MEPPTRPRPTMTITIETTSHRNGYRVTVTEPTPAIIAMASRMDAERSNMVDGWVRDGVAYLQARGSAGCRLYSWASKAAKKPAATTKPASTARTHAAYCPRCGGPKSDYGQRLCDSCRGED